MCNLDVDTHLMCVRVREQSWHTRSAGLAGGRRTLTLTLHHKRLFGGHDVAECCIDGRLGRVLLSEGDRRVPLSQPGHVLGGDANRPGLLIHFLYRLQEADVGEIGSDT